MKKIESYFASCPRELESLLEKEIKSFGITQTQIEPGGVSFECDFLETLQVILKSRIASRVFKQLQTYLIKNERELYDRAREKWWHEVFDLDQTFKINTLLSRDAQLKFKNSVFLSQKLKDAIVDQFREKLGARPNVDTEMPDVSILMRIQEHAKPGFFVASINLDLCGNSLSHRGYREAGHTAPMRENLAAGVLMSTDFNPAQDMFIDSMCGSGTLLIESLLIRGNIAPTYLRLRWHIERKQAAFAFQKHAFFKRVGEFQRVFHEEAVKVYNHALAELNELPAHQFYGFDISEKSLDITRTNLKMAKIPKEVVLLNKRDATKITPTGEPPGIIICNPPYGERMESDLERLKKLYHEYGENLKNNFKGYRAYVFTSNPELRKAISLQTKARIPFYNGNLECRLLKYELY